MENKHIVVILILVIVIMACTLGILFLHNNAETQADNQINQTESDNVQESSTPPDTIRMELPEFDRKVTKTVGEYTVEAEKWRGTAACGLGIWLYKNGQRVDQDSYLSRAYFYMDGEWKWSEWGNGEGATYHKYPVSNDVEIKEIEVKF